MRPDPYDISMMELALAQARAGASAGEVPVGAIVELEGRVIGSAHNAPIARKDPTAHAEILAIRQAAMTIGSYRIPGATLYVTLEPCAMCIGAIILARLSRLRFGARDPKAGAVGSVYDIGRDGRLNHRIEVYPGLLEGECAELLRGFFAAQRS